MQNFKHKMGHGSQPEARLSTGQHNNVAYWVSTVRSWQITRDLDHLEKNGIGTIKTAFWGLAGRFVAHTAKSGPFWVQNWCFFGPKINFLWPASKNGAIMRGHLKDNLCAEFAAFFSLHSVKKNQKNSTKKRNDPEGHISPQDFFAFTFDTILLCFFC